MLLRRLLVSEIQEEDAGEGADQEDDVKPAVVKVELQLAQDIRHDGAILQRHAHAHQQHARDKVHPLCERGLPLYLFLGACVVRQMGKPRAYHDLGQDEHDDVGRLAARYCVEELEGEKD